MVRNASKPTLADLADVELAPSLSTVCSKLRRSVRPPRLIASKDACSAPSVSSPSYQDEYTSSVVISVSFVYLSPFR